MRADFPSHRNDGIINVDPLNLLNSGAICYTAAGVCNLHKIFNLGDDRERREQMLFEIQISGLWPKVAHSLSSMPVVPAFLMLRALKTAP